MERLADEHARPRPHALHRLRRPRRGRRADRRLRRPRLRRPRLPRARARPGALPRPVRRGRPAAAARARPRRGRLTWPHPAGSSATPASRCPSSRSGPGGRGSSSPREQAASVLDHARSRGIDFLDDARYNDETGTRADPVPATRRSCSARLFRASGWPRDEVTIGNKLWWEHWPQQSPAEELDLSLERHGPRPCRLPRVRPAARRAPDGGHRRDDGRPHSGRACARVGDRQLGGRARRRGRSRRARCRRSRAQVGATALQPREARLGGEPGDERGPRPVRRERHGVATCSSAVSSPASTRRAAARAAWPSASTTRAWRPRSRRCPRCWSCRSASASRRRCWRWRSRCPTRACRRSSRRDAAGADRPEPARVSTCSRRWARRTLRR